MVFGSYLQRLFRGAAWLAVVSLLVLPACGKAVVPAGTVKGTVTLDGEPYDNAAVMFLSLQTGQGGSADIQSGGSFALVDPLPVGSYKVFLAPKASTANLEEAAPVTIDTNVPDKYWNEAGTDITADVKEGENTVTVELKK